MLNAALETRGALSSSQIVDRTAAGDSGDQNISAPSELPAKFKQYASTADGDAIPYAVVRAAWSSLRERHGLDRSDRSDQSEESGNTRTGQISPSDSCETSEVNESEAREEASGVTSQGTASSTGNTSNDTASSNGSAARCSGNGRSNGSASNGAASSYKRPDWLLHEVLQGCQVLLPAPPEPPKKSAELEARLAALKEAEEQRRYRELVRDVVPKGAKGRGAGGGVDDEEDFGGQGGSSYLASYREQLGFGMHVVGVMFTCYLLGHFAASALIKDQPALHPVGGAVGLIFGMLLETTLFIIRTTQLEEKQAKQRSKKAARKHGVSVPSLTVGRASSQGTQTAHKSVSNVAVGSEELDAVRQELIELAGRRQKGAGVSGSSGGSMVRRRNVRQADGD